jgi:hypothetical protein
LKHADFVTEIVPLSIGVNSRASRQVLWTPTQVTQTFHICCTTSCVSNENRVRYGHRR